jgi:hypothetical protein
MKATPRAAWIAGGVAAASLAAGAAGPPGTMDAALGAIAPLGVTAASWMLTERVYRRDPARLTALMIKAFAGKLMFFGLWVALMLAVVSVRPLPFVISFTAAFVVLHAMEALHLQRLFAARAGAADGGVR